MPTALPYVAGTVELGLAVVGVALLWREVLSPAARARPKAEPLPAWEVPLTSLVAFLLLVLTGSFIAAAGAGSLARPLGLRGDAATVLAGAAAQLGMLAGVVIHRLALEHQQRLPCVRQPEAFTSGLATFLISLPILMATANSWEYLLERLGLPTERQDLISMFLHNNSPLLLGIMITLAVLIAPCTEELVFRAGLFRYLRTRVPRWLALLVPALVFAALHVNWETLQGLSSFVPLVVLAILFSLAYERTGRIGTAVVAHAAFNLNTIILIFCGITA